MSNVYAIGDPTTGPSDSRYASVPSVTARLARPILLCLITLCALFLLARYAVLPVLTVRHIIFQSDVALSEDELLAISGLQGTAYWHSLDTEKVRRRLEAYPLIRKAVVEKVFPDTVRMTVWGRQAVALVLADMGGRSLPVLVDDEGVVFKVCVDGNGRGPPGCVRASRRGCVLGNPAPGSLRPALPAASAASRQVAVPDPASCRRCGSFPTARRTRRATMIFSFTSPRRPYRCAPPAPWTKAFSGTPSWSWTSCPTRGF